MRTKQTLSGRRFAPLYKQLSQQKRTLMNQKNSLSCYNVLKAANSPIKTPLWYLKKPFEDIGYAKIDPTEDYQNAQKI